MSAWCTLYTIFSLWFSAKFLRSQLTTPNKQERIIRTLRRHFPMVCTSYFIFDCSLLMLPHKIIILFKELVLQMLYILFLDC